MAISNRSASAPCAESILADASLCKHCHQQVEPIRRPVTAEATTLSDATKRRVVVATLVLVVGLPSMLWLIPWVSLYFTDPTQPSSLTEGSESTNKQAEVSEGGTRDVGARVDPVPSLTAPIQGEALVGYIKPNVEVQGDTVVTTITVKNLSSRPIAGLRIEEFWWDSANRPLPADSQRLREPLMPQDVADIVLRTPRSPDMARNSYKFSHANGSARTQLLSSTSDQ